MVRVMKIFPRSEDDHSNCYRSDSKDESDKSGNDSEQDSSGDQPDASDKSENKQYLNNPLKKLEPKF